jgi:23S rRNA (guanine745-N1)-methyltransferase
LPVTLLCTVRGCGRPLQRGATGATCERGHHFDVARSGYLNLLQPQDRRSANPGDRREAAEARRRLYKAGHGDALLDAIERLAARCGLPPRPAVLDVGCGEGSLLAGLADRLPLEGHGLDLSTPAVELAARRFPGITWAIANADRLLPYAHGSFDLVMVLSSRLNRGELRRVVASSGHLLVASPAADDLAELRAALLGESTARDRLGRAAAELAPAFALAERAAARAVVQLDAAGVRDALAATYRGARHSEQERLAAIDGLQVTFSHDLGLFRPA